MRSDKLAIGLVCAVIFLCAGQRVLAFDDVRYDIRARLDPEKHAITAQEVLTFTNNTDQDLDAVSLRVYPHHRFSAQEKRELYRYASYFKTSLFPDGFDPGTFRIDALSRADTPVSLPYTFEGKDQTVLRIALPEPLKAGASLALRIN